MGGNSGNCFAWLMLYTESFCDQREMKNTFKGIYELHCFEKGSSKKNKDFQFTLKMKQGYFSDVKDMGILRMEFLSKAGFQIAFFFVVI